MAKIDEFEKETALKDEEICYVGDEMIDLAVMKRAGFSAALPTARRRPGALPTM